MKTSAQEDALAYGTLAWAYGQKPAMDKRQHREVKGAVREARHESYESPGKRRSRLWGFGPAWARRSA